MHDDEDYDSTWDILDADYVDQLLWYALTQAFVLRGLAKHYHGQARA